MVAPLRGGIIEPEWMVDNYSSRDGGGTEDLAGIRVSRGHIADAHTSPVPGAKLNVFLLSFSFGVH